MLKQSLLQNSLPEKAAMASCKFHDRQQSFYRRQPLVHDKRNDGMWSDAFVSKRLDFVPSRTKGVVWYVHREIM